MIGISEYIVGKTVQLNESFGSVALSDIFRDEKGYLDHMFKRYLSREMQWDKITDSDIETMDTEQARRLAYKKDSSAYILWLDPQGKFMGRSIGNYNVLLDWSVERNVRNTVKSLSVASDKAVVIVDPNKFSTTEIKRIRAEQKKNALALTSDAEVARQNIKRYKAEIEKAKVGGKDIGDIVRSVKDTIANYGRLMSDICANIVMCGMKEYTEMSLSMTDMEDTMQQIMSLFKRIAYNKTLLDEYGSKNEFFSSNRREIIIGLTDKLNTKIGEFNSKYIDIDND